MKLPTEKEAIELLENHLEPEFRENHLKHVKAVARFARKTAEKLKEKGYNIDPNFVYIAALLHDIGKSRNPGPNHSITSGEILREEGYPELAETVEKHGLSKEYLEENGEKERAKEFLPKTLEEKLINFADSHFEIGKKIPWKDRVPLLKKRWPKEYHHILDKAYKRFDKNNKEIEKMLEK